ncbi:hypothetical protein [Virgibacillus siamensis]|uniref:hypothetical protein n=1 Tax=Virgibacillus siamensis TaxID=480071 RepID=UPI0009850264|nr:hypothetical protein [Virgibacillus siamensis]
MKNPFMYINDQRGFILPYVLFITALLIITITASIRLYHNELIITESQAEQVKVETLFQMAHSQFTDNLPNKNNPADNPVMYHFPYGNVKIEYIRMDTETYHLYVTITTNKQTIVSLTHRFTVDE